MPVLGGGQGLLPRSITLRIPNASAFPVNILIRYSVYQFILIAQEILLYRAARPPVTSLY